MKQLPALAILALGASGCGPKLVDCEAVAAEHAACMPASAVEECEAANEACADEPGGEVLTLESCPLQFVCSAAR